MVDLNRGKEFGSCFSCIEYAECKNTTKQCEYNKNTNIRDLQYRDEYHPTVGIFPCIDYEAIILALHNERPENRNAKTVINIVNDILESNLQDLWYLVTLNMDQIIKDANEWN